MLKPSLVGSPRGIIEYRYSTRRRARSARFCPSCRRALGSARAPSPAPWPSSQPRPWCGRRWRPARPRRSPRPILLPAGPPRGRCSSASPYAKRALRPPGLVVGQGADGFRHLANSLVRRLLGSAFFLLPTTPFTPLLVLGYLYPSRIKCMRTLKPCRFRRGFEKGCLSPARDLVKTPLILLWVPAGSYAHARIPRRTAAFLLVLLVSGVSVPTGYPLRRPAARPSACAAAGLSLSPLAWPPLRPAWSSLSARLPRLLRPSSAAPGPRPSSPRRP